MSAPVPESVRYTLEVKQALAWFYNLVEAEKYDHWRKYVKTVTAGRPYTFEQYCISMGKIHALWIAQGRPLL